MGTGAVVGVIAGVFYPAHNPQDKINAAQDTVHRATNSVTTTRAAFFAGDSTFQVAAQNKMTSLTFTSSPIGEAGITPTADSLASDPDFKGVPKANIIASIVEGQDVVRAVQAENGAEAELNTVEHQHHWYVEHHLLSGLERGAAAFAIAGGGEALVLAGIKGAVDRRRYGQAHGVAVAHTA